jgi:tRNA 2-thiouridine synthesizing protein A
MTVSLDFNVHSVLDTSGLMCPEPVMMLHRKMSEINIGDVIEVVATDPSTERDIPKFCTFLQHQLLQQVDRGKTYHYFIKKA